MSDVGQAAAALAASVRGPGVGELCLGGGRLPSGAMDLSDEKGMVRMDLPNLSTAAWVTEQLLAQYGPERLWQVERLSRHIFRGWLSDGGVALAVIGEAGELTIRELAPCW